MQWLSALILLQKRCCFNEKSNSLIAFRSRKFHTFEIMLRWMTIALFFLFLQTSFAQNQNQRVKRVFKNNDTCNALQIFSALNNFPEYKRLYLLDEYHCIKEEKLQLRQGVTWFSVPRVPKRYPTVNEVLGGDNISPNYSPYYYYFKGSRIENMPLGVWSKIMNIFDGLSWSSTGSDLVVMDPTLGYKLDLKYNVKPKQDIELNLHGSVTDTSATIKHLYAHRDNWIGYWLFQEQNIFDALGNNLKYVSSVKTQDWTCIKTSIFPDNTYESKAGTKQHWYCDTKNPNVKYGDMVILGLQNDILGFQWNLSGNKPSMQKETVPKHYRYTEQSSYMPIVVLLDTADHPSEIAVLQNGICTGASTVNANDSVVVIRNYYIYDYKEYRSDSLIFEEYYENKTVRRKKVPDYYLRNSFQSRFEKRKIIGSGKAEYLVVSFRNPEKYLKQPDMVNFNIWLDPTGENILLKYTLQKKQTVTVEVFDMTGICVSVPINMQQNKGKYFNVWNLTAFTGKKLPSGLYLLKLTAGNSVTVKKIFIE